MDARYLISGDVILASASPSLPPDSKTLRSESDIFATSARASCGVEPGLVRLRIATLSASPMGDWLYGVRKRLMFVGSLKLMSSALAILSFIVLTV